MYEVTKVITNDGKMFDTEKEARAYVERKYTDLVSRISSALSSLSKYQEVKIFLHENSESFREMLSLKDEWLEGVKEELE